MYSLFMSENNNPSEKMKCKKRMPEIWNKKAMNKPENKKNRFWRLIFRYKPHQYRNQ